MRLLILLIISVLLLSACGLAPKGKKPQVDHELTAQQFIQSGNYIAAAEEYLKLAAQVPANANGYRLQAAAALVEAGDYDRASRILSDTKFAAGDTLQNTRRSIISARINLEYGQPGKAIDELLALPIKGIPQSLRFVYHDTLSRSYQAAKNYMAAVNQRLVADDFANALQQQQNYKLLWQVLQAVPADDINNMRMEAPEEWLSWLELASIYNTYRFDQEKLSYAVDSWLRYYPDHPAATAIVPGLMQMAAKFAKRPKKIGLILPFSNHFKNASIAIRDGFLAAWYFDSYQKQRPDIKVYDADSLNIIEVYQQAVADGVEYIVGPLEKEAVEILSQHEDSPVPVLALNRLHDLGEIKNEQLIQFGLAPEDEARQIAEIAMTDGHIFALVLSPDNNWGHRIAESFKQRWLEMGGEILDHVYFSKAAKDYATPVKEMLNIDSSDARITDLRSKLNLRIHSEWRRRQDVDFIFVVAVATDARQILPQLRFYRASDLPVYSTSNIFTGVFDNMLDTDLNGVIFVDMPWILDIKHQLSMTQDALNRNWSQDKSNYRRLYALGIDAYRLIPELNRLRLEANTSISSETGSLTLGNGNIIKRKLQRAQFVNGEPALLD